MKTGSNAEKAFPQQKLASFANTSGGHIVFGIDELNDVPKELCGVHIRDAAETIRQLEQILESQITPRIPGVRIKAIDAENGNYLIVIEVPESWTKPHMVALGKSRFPIRRSNSKYYMDVQEIRLAFIQSDDIPEKMRRFRDARLVDVLSGKTFGDLVDGPKIILHFIPLNSVTTGNEFSLRELSDKSAGIQVFENHAQGMRYNLDGLLRLTTDPDSPKIGSYIQFFRDGRIEAVDSYGFNIHAIELKELVKKPERRLVANGREVERVVESITRDIMQFYLKLGVHCPISFFLSFTGTKDTTLVTGTENSFFWFHNPVAIDRDIIMIPDILVSDPAAPVESFLKPAFDIFWQASGRLHSPL